MYTFLSFYLPILSYITALILIRTKRKKVEFHIEQIQYPEIQLQVTKHLTLLYRYPLVFVISVSAKLGQVMLKKLTLYSSGPLLFILITLLAVIFAFVLTPIGVKIGAYFFRSKIAVLMEKYPMHFMKLQMIKDEV